MPPSGLSMSLASFLPVIEKAGPQPARL